MLILLLLLEEEKNANAVFGREQYRALLKRMFPEGLHEAWVAAGGHAATGGSTCLLESSTRPPNC